MKDTFVMLMVGIMLIGVFNVFLPVETCVASGNTIYVDDSGGANYTNIQDAIDAANESDTIYVYSGTYNENIIINKTLTLIGAGSESTAINGNGDHTIKISANTVSISGFKIENTGGSDACVFLSSVTNCQIENNIIKNGGHGVYIGLGSSNNMVESNTIENNNVGIYFSSSNSNTIRSNYIQNNNANGVWLYASSNNNIIYLNHFLDNNNGNAEDKCSNSWSYDHQGNYWDDYNDYDSDGNGVGDNPYVIDGDSQDDYPKGVFLNPDPVAYIDSISPNPATQGQTINFNGNGIDDGKIEDWEWRSSKDGVLSSSEDFSASSLSVGTHTIKFRVKDNDSQWSEYVEEILIINSPESQENQKPTAEIVTINPSTATSGESIYFHGLGTDSDGTVVEYNWRSSKDGILSEDSTFTKSGLSVGTHTIYFKVKDNQGEWSSEDSSILIINASSSHPNEPPTPDTGGPYAGYVNTSIPFDASKSSDPDGDNIVSYAWDFGDGISGSGATTNHSYASSGNYTVKLTVTDSQDKISTISTYVNIITQTADQNKDDEKNDNTPGFEFILAIIAMIFVLIKKRHA